MGRSRVSELNALYMAFDTITLLLAVLAVFGVVTTTGVLEQIGAGTCNATWWPLYRYEEDRGKWTKHSSFSRRSRSGRKQRRERSGRPRGGARPAKVFFAPDRFGAYRMASI